jgi:hypothetical protein
MSVNPDMTEEERTALEQARIMTTVASKFNMVGNFESATLFLPC